MYGTLWGPTPWPALQHSTPFWPDNPGMVCQHARQDFMSYDDSAVGWTCISSCTLVGTSVDSDDSPVIMPGSDKTRTEAMLAARRKAAAAAGEGGDRTH